MKPLGIVGLDPGTTSAYALLDLEGNLLKTYSAKELPLSTIIEQIMAISTPVIVSTDKARIPSLVEEFSRKVGAEILAPEEDLLREEKRTLVSPFQERLGNKHQADALAAALFAYRKKRPKLEKINHFLREKKLEEKKQDFTLLALKEDLNFSLIQELVTSPTIESTIVKQVVTEQKITKKNFLALYERMSQIQEQKQLLEQQLARLKERALFLKRINRSLEKKRKPMEEKIEALFQFKEERMKHQQEELERQKETAQELSTQIQSLSAFISKVPGKILVKKLPSLGQTEFAERNRILSIQDHDLLLVENPDIYSEKVLQQMAGRGITLVSTKNLGKVLRSRFQTFMLSPSDLQEENNYFALVERELIEKKIKGRDFIEHIVEEYRQQRD